MLPKKKVMAPLIFTVAFVLVTFAIPLTLLAGPPVDCPCYTIAEVMRYAHPPNAELIFQLVPPVYWMRVLATDKYTASFEVFVHEQYYGNGEDCLKCGAWVETTEGELIIKREEVLDNYSSEEIEKCFELLVIGLREELPPIE